jgi:two-component system NtrC family sensor kinase
MSVRLKLVVIIALVALAPLSVSTAAMLGLHHRALEAKLVELHGKSAQYGAEAVQGRLDGAIASLQPMVETSIRWAELTPEETDGALWLLYGQLRAVTAVWITDTAHRLLYPAAYLAPDEARADPGRITLRADELQSLMAAVPSGAARAGQVALGDVIALGAHRVPVLPVTFAVDPGFVHAGLSLEGVCAGLAANPAAGTTVQLLDARGRSVCAKDGLARTVDASLLTAAKEARGSFRYVRSDGEPMLAAVASARLQFRVVSEQPERDALAASRRMRNLSALYIGAGAIAAIVAGLWLARSIHRPVQRLANGAELVARGDFSARMPESGRDELANLSRTFNRMSVEIEKRDREIRGWNEELQKRVDQRTAELKETQAALLESRKIAAVASLGAGVAHEINNPLTAVLGITQLLKSKIGKSKEGELLGAMEGEAIRIRDIVQRMQTLSHAEEERGYQPVTPSEILDSVLERRKRELAEASVAVERAYVANGVRVHGNRGELEQAFDEVVDNAVKAMRGKPGTLRIATDASAEDVCKVRITDTGRGIAAADLDRVFEPFFTTKDDWHGKGLGLTLAYRVIEAHRGTIRLQSKVGEGTAVTITLPIVRRLSHLV